MNLKQKLSKKLKKTGGFTLIEMLIVVAIIAILVAVSIPMVNASLDKAREATDQANERAAKSAALIQYLSDGETTDATYVYNASDGTVEKDTGSTTTEGYGQCSKHKDGFVKVAIVAATATDDMQVNITWDGGTGGSFTSDPHNSDGTVG